MKKKPDTTVFSPDRFGNILRSERRKKGFTNTKQLSEAIKEKTGVFVDFDTLMKYERGEREPDVTKLLAIAVTIFEDKWVTELSAVLISSLPISSYGNSIFANAVMEEASRKDDAEREQKRADQLSKIAAISKAFDIKFSSAEKLYNDPDYRKIVDEVYSETNKELKDVWHDAIKETRNQKLDNENPTR